jgi:hypothetical protein
MQLDGSGIQTSMAIECRDLALMERRQCIASSGRGGVYCGFHTEEKFPPNTCRFLSRRQGMCTRCASRFLLRRQGMCTRCNSEIPVKASRNVHTSRFKIPVKASRNVHILHFRDSCESVKEFAHIALREVQRVHSP